MAGDSADEVARRSREKAERLLKRAEQFEKGAEGERLVAQFLSTLPDDWFVLNDIHWPGRSRANIDHVVIGPRGVFVIDAKNWSGTLTIKGGVLRCNGYSKTQAVDAIQAAAAAVGGLVPSVDRDAVIPVLCFVGAAQASGQVDGVEICPVESLVDLLQDMPIVFSSEQLQFLRFQLDASTGAATGPQAPDYLMPPPTGRPLQSESAPVIPLARRHRGRRSSLFKTVVAAVAMWWILCEGIYLALGRAVHYRPSVLGPAYLLAGVLAMNLVTGRRRHVRSHRR